MQCMRGIAGRFALLLAVMTSGALSAQESLAAAYARALPYRAFLAVDSTHAAAWAAATARAPASVAAVLREVRPPAGTWRLLVVAAHACTDSPEAVPYLARLAEQTSGLELRVLPRADGIALLNTHLLDGHTATPLVLLLDSTYRELGVWHERASHIQQYIAANDGKIPNDSLGAQVRALRRADDGRSPLREVIALMRSARTP